jgi:hypothetical protein
MKTIALCWIVFLTGVSRGQIAPGAPLPTDPGMYMESAGGLTKIIGQIAEFRRSGSALVSHATIGIKSQKENIQLLGPHAETVVSRQPVFYFIPAKQEAEAGVNAGDLILIRLEEKPERRQFEIAAHGAWRSSAGISLTHQVQLLRSEIKSGVYKIAPATTLTRGEYALYLSRGEGMAAYVYDFGVQGPSGAAARDVSLAPAKATAPILASSGAGETRQVTRPASFQIFKDASIGVFSDGNPDVRHDGIKLAAVTGIKAGDVVLAINDRFLYTIGELMQEISHHEPGTTIVVRYRRNSTINVASVVVGRASD